MLRSITASKPKAKKGKAAGARTLKMMERAEHSMGSQTKVSS